MPVLKNSLAGFFLVMFVAAAMIGCGGKEARVAKYMERGKSYLEQQNYDKARVEFKNVLQIDPKNAEGYFHLGEVEQGARNPRLAVGYYMKALDISPDYRNAQVKMGRIYLLVGNKEKAGEISKAMLAKNPADPDGRTLHAAIMAVNGDNAGAIKEVSEVLAANPKHVEALDLLSAIYEQTGQKNKAVEILEKAIATDRESTTLRMKLVRLYSEQNNLAKAETLLKDIVALDPDSMRNRINLALFYSRTRQLDKAESVLREAIQADTKDPQRQILLADFLAEQKGLDAAEKQLLSAIKENPDEHQLRFSLAALYGQGKQLDKMEQTYREIISQAGTAPDGLKARNKLATLMLLEGKRDEAGKLTEEVLKKNPRDNEALETKGRLALMARNSRDAIDAFRAVLKDQPAAVDVLVLLAEAHFLNDEKDLARDHLLKALEFEPAYVPAKVKLAQFYMNTGNAAEAAKVIEDGLKTAPTNLDLLIAKTDIYAAKKDTKNMRKVIETIKTSHPQSPIGYYRMGQLLAVERKYDLALHEFETALQKQPRAWETLAAIVNIHLAQNRPDNAVRWLNQRLEQAPQDAFINELIGEVYAAQQNHAEAEARFRKAIELNPNWSLPYGNLAKTLQAKGDLRGSIAVYEQGLKALPNDTVLMLYLASTYERVEDFAKAIETHEAVLQKEPNNAVAANNLASLLSDHRTDEKSLARARELAERFQSDQQPYFRDTLGWVYYRQGEVDKAIPILEKNVSDLPNEAVFHYHLGMAYYKKGNTSAAKTHLTKALESKEPFSGMQEARTTLAQIK